MATKKKVTVDDSKQVAKQPAEESSTSQPEVNAISETVVIGVFRGFLDNVKEIFPIILYPVPVNYIFLEESEGDDFSKLDELAAATLLRDDIPECFTLIPAGTIPCKKLDLAACKVPTVCIRANGERAYASGLPVYIESKSKLAAILGSIDDNLAPEEYTEKFAEALLPEGIIPAEVSFHFGNWIAPIISDNPCDHRVIEALLRRKFVTTTRTNLSHITTILKS